MSQHSTSRIETITLIILTMIIDDDVENLWHCFFFFRKNESIDPNHGDGKDHDDDDDFKDDSAIGFASVRCSGKDGDASVPS